MTSLITKSDLGLIISNAKSQFTKFNLPLHISDKEVEQTELVALALLESTLVYLNRKGLLTNLVSMDYTDPGAAHDPETPLESVERPE